MLWLLLALSVVSLAVALERYLAFRQTRGDVATLVPGLRRFLQERNYNGALRLLMESRSVEGRVVAAGIHERDAGVKSVQEAMSAAMGLERKRLESRLLFLGTVGNNAPFVGLLGTVIGVIGAFDALGKPQAMASALAQVAAPAPERVMGAIAESLVATATGLAVAIPAVAAFNYFQGRLATALADAETLGHVLLGHLDDEVAAARHQG